MESLIQAKPSLFFGKYYKLTLNHFITLLKHKSTFFKVTRGITLAAHEVSGGILLGGWALFYLPNEHGEDFFWMSSGHVKSKHWIN